MATNTGQEKVKKIITDRILEQLNNGVVPWRKPWIGVGSAWNRRNGKPYSIINQMLLDDVGEYATFNAISREGGKINKGSHGQYVLEWFFREYEIKDEDGNVVLDENTQEPVKRKRWHMRYEKVFNIEKDTNLKVRYNKEMVKRFDGKPIDIAEQCFNHYLKTQGIRLKHADPSQAYYAPIFDVINLPNFEQFEVPEEYYSTAFHEAAHSTGHAKRLNRLDMSAHFHTKAYGKEELVAELTSAAVCNQLGIEIDSTFMNSTAYIASWVKSIKGGEADVISASSYADKAFALILKDFIYKFHGNPKDALSVSIKNIPNIGKVFAW